MNAQEIFDKVATHLSKQGHRAFDDNACMYRSPNGDKCAMGCLIPDEEYNADTMEGRGASILLVYDFVKDMPVMSNLYQQCKRKLVRKITVCS